MKLLFYSLFLYSFLAMSCPTKDRNTFHTNNFEAKAYEEDNTEIITGAERSTLYVPKLRNKNVALVVNQTSVIDDLHIIDSLVSLEIQLTKIFSPEHGLEGKADAGEKISDSSWKNIPIISLYGKNKKPKTEDLKNVDIVVFDIQDVGVRFYTYISTLHYVMEACAENNIPLIVLDRPNPNGFYIDGPILEEAFSSFIGMHSVPVVYGMTIGEYAQMINGENWLPNNLQCELEVISCKNYDHNMSYDLPIAPSPNLPNLSSILLYPSLCFFEGTTVSIGRGTDFPFQVFGHPKLDKMNFSFMPKSGFGSKYPKLENELCYGNDLRNTAIGELLRDAEIRLEYVMDTYQKLKNEEKGYFLSNNFFNKLAGTDKLKVQIESNQSEKEIRESWQAGLKNFKKTRKKYLLYPDFLQAPE